VEGGGIPCRPNSAATLLVASSKAEVVLSGRVICHSVILSVCGITAIGLGLVQSKELINFGDTVPDTDSGSLSTPLLSPLQNGGF